MPATREVRAPDGLTWRLRRLVVPMWMRPITPASATIEYAEAARSGAMGAGRYAGPAVLFGLIWSVAALPLLPGVLALRRLGVVPWTVEAKARPWGRRGPPIVLLYSVRRPAAVADVLDSLARALERGDGAPLVEGAERVEI